MNAKEYIRLSINTKKKILDNSLILSEIEKISDKITEAYLNNNKVLTAGNGGSAADAQHIACELVARFMIERKGLTAYSLSTDTSVMTAISNDYGYENLFSRQIETSGNKGDIFIAISTSGNSKNIIKALDTAKDKGLINIGLTGEKSSDMDKLCDYIIKVPSEITPIIQESHIMIAHLVCALVEEKIFH